MNIISIFMVKHIPLLLYVILLIKTHFSSCVVNNKTLYNYFHRQLSYSKSKKPRYLFQEPIQLTLNFQPKITEFLLFRRIRHLQKRCIYSHILIKMHIPLCLEGITLFSRFVLFEVGICRGGITPRSSTSN